MPRPSLCVRAFALALLLGLASSALARAPVHAGTQEARLNLTRRVRAYVSGYEREAATAALPPEAREVRYVLVKGLFGNHYPGYLGRSAASLRRSGLDARFAPINTAGSVAHNAAIIRSMILSSDKPIVFIGHSKGTTDVSHAIAALHAESPGLVEDRVRGLISLQGAYGGSPIAELFARGGIGRLLVRGFTRLLGGSPDSVFDLTRSARRAAHEAAPMPTQVVPTISLVGYGKSYWSLLAPGLAIFKHAFKTHSDGLVGVREAVVPGSDVVRLPIDHVSGAYGAYSERLTLGLVSELLSLPRDRMLPEKPRAAR